MGLNLSKGETLNLTKEVASLEKVRLACGWDPVEEGASIDMDLSVYVKRSTHSDSNMCYFGNKNILNGAVVHSGDNLTGEGDGDDEAIDINLKALPEDATKVVVLLNIYQAKERNQAFNKVQNAFARIVNMADKSEIVRTEVNKQPDAFDNLVFAQFVKKEGDWIFEAVHDFGNGDLNYLMNKVK